MKRPDIESIIEKVRFNGLSSSDRNIEDTIAEMIINAMTPQIEALTVEALELLEHIESINPKDNY